MRHEKEGHLTTDLTALAEGSTPSITGETSTSLAALLKPIKKPLKVNYGINRVYADWEGLDGPARIGYLHSRRTRAREIFEFEYDKKALADPSLNFIQLDPEIMLYEGAQYPIPPKDKFGAFSDSCPDRWGRMLMKRRFERDIRDGLCDKDSHLYESDYLLGVHDLYRVGALRTNVKTLESFLIIALMLQPTIYRNSESGKG